MDYQAGIHNRTIKYRNGFPPVGYVLYFRADGAGMTGFKICGEQTEPERIKEKREVKNFKDHLIIY